MECRVVPLIARGLFPDSSCNTVEYRVGLLIAHGLFFPGSSYNTVECCVLPLIAHGLFPGSSCYTVEYCVVPCLITVDFQVFDCNPWYYLRSIAVGFSLTSKVWKGSYLRRFSPCYNKGLVFQF